jgi:hypothetical protein
MDIAVFKFANRFLNIAEQRPLLHVVRTLVLYFNIIVVVYGERLKVMRLSTFLLREFPV